MMTVFWYCSLYVVSFMIHMCMSEHIWVLSVVRYFFCMASCCLSLRGSVAVSVFPEISDEFWLCRSIVNLFELLNLCSVYAFLEWFSSCAVHCTARASHFCVYGTVLHSEFHDWSSYRPSIPSLMKSGKLPLKQHLSIIITNIKIF